MSNLESSTDTIYGVLNGTRVISDVIRKTEFKNLDIITSNVDLSGLEVETADDSMRAFILKRELTAYLNDSGALYDYILPCLTIVALNGLKCFGFHPSNKLLQVADNKIYKAFYYRE